MENKRIKYLSLFTGIGGFDLPLRELNFECVGWSEIDKYAIKTFEANFPDEFHNKAKEVGVSNTQLYKQAGNSVTVNVIRCILNSLFNGSNKTQLNLF